jgi:hypothetical protein
MHAQQINDWAGNLKIFVIDFLCQHNFFLRHSTICYKVSGMDICKLMFIFFIARMDGKMIWPKVGDIPNSKFCFQFKLVPNNTHYDVVKYKLNLAETNVDRPMAYIIHNSTKIGTYQLILDEGKPTFGQSTYIGNSFKHCLSIRDEVMTLERKGTNSVVVNGCEKALGYRDKKTWGEILYFLNIRCDDKNIDGTNIPTQFLLKTLQLWKPKLKEVHFFWGHGITGFKVKFEDYIGRITVLPAQSIGYSSDEIISKECRVPKGIGNTKGICEHIANGVQLTCKKWNCEDEQWWDDKETLLFLRMRLCHDRMKSFIGKCNSQSQTALLSVKKSLLEKFLTVEEFSKQIEGVTKTNGDNIKSVNNQAKLINTAVELIGAQIVTINNNTVMLREFVGEKFDDLKIYMNGVVSTIDRDLYALGDWVHNTNVILDKQREENNRLNKVIGLINLDIPKVTILKIKGIKHDLLNETYPEFRKLPNEGLIYDMLQNASKLGNVSRMLTHKADMERLNLTRKLLAFRNKTLDETAQAKQDIARSKNETAENQHNIDLINESLKSKGGISFGELHWNMLGSIMSMMILYGGALFVLILKVFCFPN